MSPNRMRPPSHGTVIAYLALFGPGAQVKAADVAFNAVNGADVAE